MKLIDISFYANNDCDDLQELIKKHKPAIGYVDYLKLHVSVQVIKHLDYEGTATVNGVKYSGFKSRNRFGYIPFKTIRYIKKEKPDIVIIQGLIFPLLVIILKMKLGKATQILVQHHGERPSKGIKQWFQRRADRFIAGYLFTSMENAREWFDLKIISDKKKCFELLEASTHFEKQDKLHAKYELKVKGNLNFLWVGRLNTGKDPLTVIKAFEIFCNDNPAAKLYMIYQTEELLPGIKNILEKQEKLQQKIILKGQVPHEELGRWYNAADFYISGSHKEGSGYALLEAMACGCIPVVTNIPSFNKITDNGKYGILYAPGVQNDLLKALRQLKNIDRDKMSASIIKYFRETLSFKSIANELYAICKRLTGK